VYLANRKIFVNEISLCEGIYGGVLRINEDRVNKEGCKYGTKKKTLKSKTGMYMGTNRGKNMGKN
jgi:hypothetical protein